MRIEDPRPPDRVARDGALVHLLQRLWTYSLTTKADDVRVFADEVAEAASRQFITTQIVPGGSVYGRIWKPTVAGLEFLFANRNLLTEEEVRYATDHCK